MSRRLPLRRLLALSALAPFLLVAPTPASAGTTAGAGRHLDGMVSGPLSGTTTSEVGEGDCYTRQVFEGTFEPEVGRRPGTIVVEGCVDPIGGPPVFTGTFVIVTDNGSRLSGTAQGRYFIAQLPDVNVTMELTVTAATRRFRRTTGTVALDLVWESPSGVGSVDDVTGSLDASLTRGRGPIGRPK